MHRSRKMLLLFVAFALEVNALAVHARSDDACRPIPVGVDALGEPSLVLRNSSQDPVTLALSFRPSSNPASAQSCGRLSLAAGHDTGVRSLASLCPGLPSAQVGVLNACVVRTRTAPRLPTGDLGSDLLTQALPVAGR